MIRYLAIGRLYGTPRVSFCVTSRNKLDARRDAKAKAQRLGMVCDSWMLRPVRTASTEKRERERPWRVSFVGAGSGA